MLEFIKHGPGMTWLHKNFPLFQTCKKTVLPHHHLLSSLGLEKPTDHELSYGLWTTLGSRGQKQVCTV